MKKINFVIVIIVLIFCLSHTAFASTLSLISDKSEIKTGGVFTSSILLDAQNAPINTIEGDLFFDQNLVKPEMVNIGNSFISFWVEKPTVNNTGKIHFSGIVPGGVNLLKGEVFRVVFRANNTGETNLSLNNVNLYINDGQGTKDSTNIENVNIKITQGDVGYFEEINKTDKTAPEIFKIVRTHDPSVFDNKYFVVFGTQDKGVGVDHYLVCEYLKKDCINSASPYLLKYQNPFYRIIITAYDTEGNIQEVILTSPWLFIIIICLLILLIKCVYTVRRRYFKKNRV